MFLAKKCGFTPIQIEQCSSSSVYSAAYPCEHAFDLNIASGGWYSLTGDAQPTIELSWSETKLITRVMIVTSAVYNMNIFKVMFCQSSPGFLFFFSDFMAKRQPD